MSDEDWDPNLGCYSDSSVENNVNLRDEKPKSQTEESNNEMEDPRDQNHSAKRAAETEGNVSLRNNNLNKYFSGSDNDDGQISAQGISGKISYENFFTYPEFPQESDDNSSDNNSNPLHSFYNEALTTKRPISSKSQTLQSQFLSQTPSCSQQTSISLAEMSRLEENFLSQTSYRDEEDERQRKKMKRKRSFQKVGILGRKSTKAITLTDAQKKRNEILFRLKYVKRVDVSEEKDVGGAMEYLLRKKFETKGEKRRLMQIAEKRSDDKKRKEEDEHKRHAAQLWEHLEENSGLSSSSSSSKSSQGSSSSKKQKRESNDETKSLEGKKCHEKLDKTPGDNLNWNFQKEGYVVMKSTDANQLPFYLYQGSTRKLKGANKYLMDDGLVADEGEIVEDQDGTDRIKHQSMQILLDAEDGSSSVGSKARTNTKRHHQNHHPFPSEYAFSIDEPDHVTHSFPLHFYQHKSLSELRANIDMRAEGPDRLVLLHGRHAKRLWNRMVAGGVDGIFLGENTDDNAKSEGDESMSNISLRSSYSSSKSVQASNPRFETKYSSLSPFESTSAVNTMLHENDDEDETSNKPKNQVFRLMFLTHSLPKVFHRNRYLLKIAQELGTFRYLWENELKQWIEMSHDSYPDKSHLKHFLSPNHKWVLKSFMGVLGDIHSGFCWASDPVAPTHPDLLTRRVIEFRRILLPRLRRLIRLENKLVKGPKVNSGESSAVAETESKNAAAKSGEEINSFPSTLFDFLESDPIPEGEGKYAKVIHDTRIDVSNIPVAMSSFLDKLSFFIAKLENINKSKDPSKRHETRSSKENIYRWHESIMAYLDFVEEQTRPHGTDLLKVGGKAPQSPPLAQSILTSQSYLANGGGIGRGSKKKLKTTSHHEMKGEEVDTDDDDHNYWDSDLDDEWFKNLSGMNSDSKELSYIQLAAKEIARRGMEHFTCENLQIFSPVHLITGVAVIAKSVTPQAAEIISRPCGRGCPNDPTPFELFSDMLVYLEKSNNLVPSPLDTAAIWKSRGKVIDSALLDVLENAATIFKKCVQKEPHNVDNWSWYLATRLGILCISSGLPLTECSNDNDVSKSMSKGRISSPRSRTANFYLKLKNSARAMLDFIDFAQCEGCAMFHLNIASMLEWRVAMYHFSLCQSTDNFFLELRQLHAFQVRVSFEECKNPKDWLN